GDEPRFALTQERHVVGFLLYLSRFVVLHRYIEQNDAGCVVLGEKMEICDAPARHAHRWNRQVRFRQRQEAFEERQLIACRLLALQSRKAVMVEVASDVDQNLIAVDEQMGYGALRSDPLQKPFRDPRRQIGHVMQRGALPVSRTRPRRPHRSSRWFARWS